MGEIPFEWEKEKVYKSTWIIKEKKQSHRFQKKEYSEKAGNLLTLKQTNRWIAKHRWDCE